MGLNMAGKSCWTNPEQPAPNPSPTRWELETLLQYKNAYVMMVRYHDCKNFEGQKIMVFYGKYSHRNYLDPHFSEKDTSPIARFRPTTQGLQLAMTFANGL